MQCIIGSLSLRNRILVPCGAPKLHKEKGNPQPYRPVASVIDRSFHWVSRWEHTHLRELLDQKPSYAKNSNDIALILKCLNSLDDNVFIFKVDSASTHPNTNIKEGLTFYR